MRLLLVPYDGHAHTHDRPSVETMGSINTSDPLSDLWLSIPNGLQRPGLSLSWWIREGSMESDSKSIDDVTYDNACVICASSSLTRVTFGYITVLLMDLTLFDT